jgi:hypothetical protein
MSNKSEGDPLYIDIDGPALQGYHPAWLDNLAEDAVLEGSMLDGAVQGAEAVRSVVTTIRSLYDRQAHKYAGPCGEFGFIEDYVALVHGEPIGCVVLVRFNKALKAQHIVASYRPRTTVVHFAQLLAQAFANTEIGTHFAEGHRLARPGPDTPTIDRA